MLKCPTNNGTSGQRYTQILGLGGAKYLKLADNNSQLIMTTKCPSIKVLHWNSLCSSNESSLFLHSLLSTCFVLHSQGLLCLSYTY